LGDALVIVLALETTGDICSVCIRDHNGLKAERVFRHEMHLSERLIAEIDGCLQDCGITLNDVEGFGVGVGPGSFTGVRIGVMTVKTWADLLGKPVAGISALDALAWPNRGMDGVSILSMIRARPGSVYARLYRAASGGVEPVGEAEMLTTGETVQLAAKEVDKLVLVCGDGQLRHGEEIKAGLASAGVRVLTGSMETPRASVIAEMAAVRIAAGDVDDPLQLVPYYLAPPPINMPRTQVTEVTKPESKQPADAGGL
jgi:tRNA threonylcarbamoyladenosine biosynthesis protein TsaB